MLASFEGVAVDTVMVSVQVPLLVALPVALAALGAHVDSPNIAVGVVGFVHCLSQEAPTRVRLLLVSESTRCPCATCRRWMWPDTHPPPQTPSRSAPPRCPDSPHSCQLFPSLWQLYSAMQLRWQLQSKRCSQSSTWPSSLSIRFGDCFLALCHVETCRHGVHKTREAHSPHA